MITYKNAVTDEEYTLLRSTTGWTMLKEAQVKKLIENSEFLISAHDGEKVVGMVRAMYDYAYVVYVADVVVAPEYQGQGIGMKMMELLIEQARKTACCDDKLMFVLVAAKGKEPFYEKLGFVSRPNEDFGAGMTQWICGTGDINIGG